MSEYNAKTHPANIGLDFHFQDTVSKEVLCNYLSRSIMLDMDGINERWSHQGVIMNSEDSERIYQDNVRLILNIGAKYIARAYIPWCVLAKNYQRYPQIKERIASIHEMDPDVVFEGCIFETTSPEINEIPIPAWVFEEFGLPAEDRCFEYERTLFPGGWRRNNWANNLSVPDMTQLETQMFFFYRACNYIDMGFEAIHMGQVHLIGERDDNWDCWQKVLNMIRSYAKRKARRGFVFINAHTHGLVGPDGTLLFDFHAYPSRVVEPDNSMPHLPGEGNPQEGELRVGHIDSIYQKSLGGKTYSGWTCDSLPYFVELDNWGIADASIQNLPVEGQIWCWGYDEISWFANQPDDYRRSWLKYAYEWVRKTDPVGFFQMPGNRTAALRCPDGKVRELDYYCNDAKFRVGGFSDEETIRQIWIEDRKNR